MPENQEQPKSWNRRMAEQLAEIGAGAFTADIIEATLEAAGEIKCVRLKVALGRCLEIIRTSEAYDTAASIPSEFSEEAYALLK